MHLVYFSHSYRKEDDEVNKMFEDLMISEGMVASIDPPSDRLNSAKPERHLRSTDGLISVLPYRDTGPSSYILYEIKLAMRARRPLLVFVEDTLPTDSIPKGILARRFSRSSLLRQIRDQRHALHIFRDYMSPTPPPSYQPSLAQRSCLLIGASRLLPAVREKIKRQIVSLRYSPVIAAQDGNCLETGLQDQDIAHASFAVAFTEDLTPREYHCLGIVRGALTPTITLTGDADYAYDLATPGEYQPRFVDVKSAESICATVAREVSIFEEDYLDLKDEKQIERYKFFKDLVLAGTGTTGRYEEDARTKIIDMSTTNITNYGILNLKSKLQNVTQTVTNTQNLPAQKKDELTALVEEMKKALEPIADSHPRETQRVATMLDESVKEATEAKPESSFLKITTDGLKAAAESIKDIAPAVLTVATKIIAFVHGVGL